MPKLVVIGLNGNVWETEWEWTNEEDFNYARMERIMEETDELSIDYFFESSYNHQRHRIFESLKKTEREYSIEYSRQRDLQNAENRIRDMISIELKVLDRQIHLVPTNESNDTNDTNEYERLLICDPIVDVPFLTLEEVKKYYELHPEEELLDEYPVILWWNGKDAVYRDVHNEIVSCPCSQQNGIWMSLWSQTELAKSRVKK